MSKYGPLKQLAPGFEEYRENYVLAWDINNEEYVKFIAVFQKFIDQSISTNLYYDIKKYNDNKVPVRDLIRHETTAYKYGLKTLYDLNSNDNSGEASQLSAQQSLNDTETTPKESEPELVKCEGGACAV